MLNSGKIRYSIVQYYHSLRITIGLAYYVVPLVMQLCKFYHNRTIKNCKINMCITYIAQQDGRSASKCSVCLVERYNSLSLERARDKYAANIYGLLVSIFCINHLYSVLIYSLFLYQSRQSRAQTPPSRVESGSWYYRISKHRIKFVTCYGKIDHLQFFIKTEFLAWIDSPMCAESNGASFMKKY